MARSLFQLAFDHVEGCDRCELGRVLCNEGRALFEAAHDKCVELANPIPAEATAKA